MLWIPRKFSIPSLLGAGFPSRIRGWVLGRRRKVCYPAGCFRARAGSRFTWISCRSQQEKSQAKPWKNTSFQHAARRLTYLSKLAHNASYLDAQVFIIVIGYLENFSASTSALTRIWMPPFKIDREASEFDIDYARTWH